MSKRFPFALPRRPSMLPLRWRLVLVLVAVLALILSVYGAALYKQVEGALIDTTASGLRTSARPSIIQYNRAFAARSATPVAGASGTPEVAAPAVLAATPGTVEEHSLSDLARALTGRTIAARTIDITGTTIGDGPVLASMGEVTAPLLDADIYREVAALKEERHWRMETASGPVLIDLIPLVPGGGDQSAIGVLQLSTTLRNGDALLESLRNQLLIGSVLAFIATIALTLPLVRGVLSPLRRMAATSRAITGGDLGQRVRVPEGGDALAELAIAFNAMVGKLDGALATQRRFIADASHELRTPLTALGNGVEMLQMGVDQRDPEARAKLLRLMSGEIARMGRLVDDLLTLSALDRDPLRVIAHTPVDLTTLIAQVVDETRLLAPDLRVELSLASQGALAIRGDSDRIRQALLNLCANARAHTPQGGSITIALAQGDDDAIVSVTDTGSGIPEEALSRVWDRFFRVDPSRERRGGGVGLGLAIVRAIVEAHGGTVTITSTVGVGTVVKMTFPLVPTTTRAPIDEEANMLAAPRQREVFPTTARSDG